MAIVKFVPYQGGQIHADRTNKYIANGHGDEVLTRTNRYITGEHACGNRCRGYNCPSDPELATEFMEQLRVQYEHNRSGRGLQGATTDEQGAAHYQVVASWHTSENPTPEERYEMGQELIRRTKLKNHAVLMSPHDNTDENHLHLSVSAFSLDGTHKLCMNNALLNTLRREMDYICVERGYSIIDNPELWGDPDYKKWLDGVMANGEVTIHPPELRDKKTEKEEYAEAKKEEREAEELRKAKLAEPVTFTEENRGTDFYSLPHVYHPQNPSNQLYIYALGKEGERKSPLQLDMHLQFAWANGCLVELKNMPDFPGKKSLAERLTTTHTNAWEAYELMGELDIGTRAELKAHIQGVGGDISKCKQEISRQENVIATAKEEVDTLKLERAEARKAKAEEKLKLRNEEYRKLKRAEAVMSDIYDGEHWQEFKQELLKKSTQRVKSKDYEDRMIRQNYYDIAQMFDIPREDIDELISKARAVKEDEIMETWTETRGQLRIYYTRRATGLTALYDSIRDDYINRWELRKAWYDFEREFPVIGPVTLILYLALAIPLAIAEARAEAALEHRIAYTRQLAEDIRWHNKHAKDQFNGAKTLLAFKLMNVNEEFARAAWAEFDATCERIMERTEELRRSEAMYANGDYYSSVKSIAKDYYETKALQAERPEETPPAEVKPMGKLSLDDMIKGADAKAAEQKSIPSKEREYEK